MAKTPKKHGTDWSKSDVTKLKKLIKENTPTPLLAWKMERTPDSVRSKVAGLGLSLKPTNKSPYNRRKK